MSSGFCCAVVALADLQREEECFPFFAPEVGHDASGCDGEHQGHHDPSLTQAQEGQKHLSQLTDCENEQWNKDLHDSFLMSECVPCGSSEGTTSDPQTADTLPAPEQYLNTISCRQTGTLSDNLQVYLGLYKECHTIKTCS